MLPAYIPLIEKYSLDLLELCEDSEKLAKELVSTWLNKYMFKEAAIVHLNRLPCLPEPQNKFSTIM